MRYLSLSALGTRVFVVHLSETRPLASLDKDKTAKVPGEFVCLLVAAYGCFMRQRSDDHTPSPRSSMIHAAPLLVLCLKAGFKEKGDALLIRKRVPDRYRTKGAANPIRFVDP
jgi:hypothetical protein